VNGIGVNNMRCEANRNFRNGKKEYLKDRNNELAMSSKDKNIRPVYRNK
jgi:hypothetical protein